MRFLAVFVFLFCNYSMYASPEKEPTEDLLFWNEEAQKLDWFRFGIALVYRGGNLMLVTIV